MSSSIFFQNSQQNLPNGYRIRKLEIEDYDKGYKELLSQLTETGDMKKETFQEAFRRCMNNRYHHVVVVENVEMKKIVATGTMFIEQKFVHDCGKVGHITDLQVDRDAHRKNIGPILFNQLVRMAKSFSVYKCMLSTNSNKPNPNSQDFYTIC
jgi:glucosamine-phosphate N-acetyltransferase